MEIVKNFADIEESIMKLMKFNLNQPVGNHNEHYEKIIYVNEHE
jgi:hypothetical protein